VCFGERGSKGVTDLLVVGAGSIAAEIDVEAQLEGTRRQNATRARVHVAYHRYRTSTLGPERYNNLLCWWTISIEGRTLFLVLLVRRFAGRDNGGASRCCRC
jgi:hypothetical protein